METINSDRLSDMIQVISEHGAADPGFEVIVAGLDIGETSTTLSVSDLARIEAAFEAAQMQKSRAERAKQEGEVHLPLLDAMMRSVFR